MQVVRVVVRFVMGVQTGMGGRARGSGSGKAEVIDARSVRDIRRAHEFTVRWKVTFSSSLAAAQSYLKDMDCGLWC